MPTIAAGATNKNVTIAPHGTGKVVVGTGAADATLQSDGDHNLVLQTGNSTTGKIEIEDGANGNIDLTPNGTGEVDIAKVDIDGGAVDGITLGTNSAVTEAQIDNLNIDGNAITSTDTNGDIDLTPAGTGEVNISKVDIDSGAIDGTTIATSDVTVGSGKTLDVSAGTLTSSTAQKQAIIDGATLPASLPSQTGNAEKILKTSGSAASWVATRKLIASTDGIQRSDATAVLSEDGSNVATLDNVTLGSSAVFPAGHVVTTSFNGGDTDPVNTTSTTFIDTALEIGHTTALSSTDSYLIFEFYTPASGPSDANVEMGVDVTMRTIGGTESGADTYTVGDSIATGASEAAAIRYSTGALGLVIPLFSKLFCGEVTGMEMPASKTTWLAGDTLYFRMFIKTAGSSVPFYFILGTSTYSLSITEVAR